MFLVISIFGKKKIIQDRVQMRLVCTHSFTPVPEYSAQTLRTENFAWISALQSENWTIVRVFGHHRADPKKQHKQKTKVKQIQMPASLCCNEDTPWNYSESSAACLLNLNIPKSPSMLLFCRDQQTWQG